MPCTILIAAETSDRIVEMTPLFAQKYRDKGRVYVLHLWGSTVGRQRKKMASLKFMPIGSIYLSENGDLRWLRIKGGKIVEVPVGHS